MKFRYKVIIINIFLLSITLGIVGFILMLRTYRITMDSAVKSAVTTNNLVQSSVEYSLLDIINSSEERIKNGLPSIGKTVYSGMISGEERLIIRYNDEYVYLSCPYSDNFDYLEKNSFFDFSGDTMKNYMILREDDRVFIYVTSYSGMGENTLNVITGQDITDIDLFMRETIANYRNMTIIILSSSTLLLYIISRLLTRPLEQLSTTTDSFANGDYSIRSHIKSSDEVGNLSERFNSMADSVEDHVEELNDMIHRREQFVADFTHEIKTPMTSIIGYADTMRSLELSHEEQQTALNYIFSEGKRLEAMSMKLFDLLYLKDHPIEMLDISTAVLAKNVTTSITPLMEASGISLKYDIEPAVIKGDQALLETVFINLLDNSRKASSAGGTVEFIGKSISSETSNPDKEKCLYRFTVKDYGIGISDEDKKKIFDEFFMADKSRTRAAGGAGLGMSLVSVILSRHNTSPEIESTLGEGTSIYIDFEIIRSES